MAEWWALPIFGGWIDCSLGLDDQSCLDSCNANPSASPMLVFYPMHEYSFKSSYFVLDMGMAGVAGGLS